MTVMLEFPVTAVPITNPSLALSYNTRPGQQATNGMRRSIGMSGAQFKLKFEIFVHDEQTVRTMRGFLFNMEADINLVRIRMPDIYGIDGPFADATRERRALYPNGIPFATDAMFDTGVGFALPTLDTTLTAAAGLNDREIYVAGSEAIPGGCAISIDEFCYGIAGSWFEDGVNRLKLSPPLRKAAAIGDTVSLAPVFVGHCVTDAPGYEALTNGWYGKHTLEFVEDLTRLVSL